MYKITIYKKTEHEVKIIKDFIIFEPPSPDEILRELVKKYGGDFFDICRTDIEAYLDAKYESEKRHYVRNFFDSG
jgi:hypothetical protein